MKDRIIEEAVNVLKSEPEGLYCTALMQRIREARPELAHESFGMDLRNWKQEDASAPEPLLATHDETGFFRLAPTPLSRADLYDDEELAEIMNVRSATILQWKTTGQIPKNCITSEGRYIKSVIDPMIAVFRKAFPDAAVEPETDRVYSRKKLSFAHEDVLRMSAMHDEGKTLVEIAGEFGCSQSTISRVLRRQGNPDAPASVEELEAPAERTVSVEFEDFVRDYWSAGTRAVDMLFLPPEVRSHILLAVREALIYAYERLNRTASPEPDAEEVESLPLLRFAQSMNPRPSPEPPNKSVRQETARQSARRGRPEGSGKYGCKTKAIRVPAHLVADVAEFARTRIGTESDDDGIVYRRTPK